MRRTFRFPLLVAAALPLLAAIPARAQYYSPYQSSPWQQQQTNDWDPPLGSYDNPLPYGSYERPQQQGRAYGDPESEPQSASPSQGKPHAKGRRLASLPVDADPNYSTPISYDDEIDPNQSTANMISDPTGEPAGTITIDTRKRKLYLSLAHGQAIEYGVGVGREGFAWKGRAEIGRKAFWPGWTPPKEMLLRRPDLPKHMDGGLENPLGARALYLFKGPKDTLFRIHGTNEPETIGRAVSSGCIRMLNADIIDLYRRATKGSKVVVL